ncbi:uncharacterized protein LOC124282363 isoform X2 [Haliotis rubra]|nr:uncharacterized protein LOC124282363 isoform X2 [Haliotis rubra]XP_046574291.1 uncharacterized protein LOC124282363 isoform X2 [Haliotis rubra]
MDGRALTSRKCIAVILTINVALIATFISISLTKTYDAQEGSVPGTIRSTVLDFLNLTKEGFAEDHSMSVIDLLNDPEVGTTLIQHFRLQENRIVVLNSSIYDMHTTVLYNVTSSDGARLELEFLKTNAYGRVQTLTRTSYWCKGRQLCSLTLGGTFVLSVPERLHFEANYIKFIIGAIPNSHITLVHVMGR